MKFVLCAAVLSVLMLPTLASSQDSVQGYWTGEVQGDNGGVPVQMQLRLEGNNVLGSIIVSGSELGIKDGRLGGNIVEFTTTRIRLADRDVTFNWSGTFSGNQIAFSLIAEDREGPVTELVVKRQK